MKFVSQNFHYFNIFNLVFQALNDIRGFLKLENSLSACRAIEVKCNVGLVKLVLETYWQWEVSIFFLQKIYSSTGFFLSKNGIFKNIFYCDYYYVYSLEENGETFFFWFFFPSKLYYPKCAFVTYNVNKHFISKKTEMQLRSK